MASCVTSCHCTAVICCVLAVWWSGPKSRRDDTRTDEEADDRGRMAEGLWHEQGQEPLSQSLFQPFPYNSRYVLYCSL